MCNFIGIDKSSLNNWRSGKSGDQRIKEYAYKILQIFEELAVGYLQEGQMFAPSAMFLLKSVYGYSDQPQKQVEETVESVSVDMAVDEIMALTNGSNNVIQASFEEVNEDK